MFNRFIKIKNNIKTNHPKLWMILRSTWKFTEGAIGMRDITVYTYYKELDVIFISLAKNANTTINRMFFDKLGLPYDPNDYHSIHRYKSKHLNITQKEFLSMNTENLFVFAFTRNPFSRLISSYENKIVNEKYWNMNYNYFGMFYHEMPFREFAEKVCRIPDWWADIHFRSQTKDIYPKDINNIDYIGKVENFSQDIKPIINMFNLPTPTITNRTKGEQRDSTKYYTERLIQKVEKRYKDDFTKLDYPTSSKIVT